MSAYFDDLDHLNLFLAWLGGELDNVARLLPSLDLDRFADWCRRHQLGGLAYQLMDEASLALPQVKPTVPALRTVHLEQWARTERLRLTLAILARALREAGEPFLVLKGLPFAERYYGGYDRRATGDLDIWVPRDRAAAVADHLEASGLQRRSPRYRDGSSAFGRVHQVEFDLDGTAVELHHALRVHPTFAFADDDIWRSRTPVDLQGDRYDTLSDEYALTLHLLGLHTDVQIGLVNGRWFADLMMLLQQLEPAADWSAFFEARQRDGTRTICVNSLALFFVLTRRDDVFPRLSAALAAYDRDVVLRPDRRTYLELLRGESLVDRKVWPLKQYASSTASAAAWWLSGLPSRIAAKPDAFARDAHAGRAANSPWVQEKRRSGLASLDDEFGVAPGALREAVLRFGSLTATVRYERASDLDALRELFRLHARPGDGLAGRLRQGESANLVVTMTSASRDRPPLPRLPSAALVPHPLEHALEIREHVITAWVRDESRLDAYVLIDRDRETRPLVLHALMVVMNKILAWRHRYHLHAAAVGFDGTALLFVGRKGSGKSTISLALARAGATIFSEDHVMLRRHDGRFLASGCDANMHLTPATEQHFFDRPIEGRPVPGGDVVKKQIDLTTVATCRPYEDVPVAALFFPTITDRFEVRPLAKEDAVARLLEPLLPRHRFVDARDREEFLNVFAELVETRETWELSLSRDLRDLNQLVQWLAAQRRPSTSAFG